MLITSSSNVASSNGRAASSTTDSTATTAPALYSIDGHPFTTIISRLTLIEKGPHVTVLDSTRLTKSRRKNVENGMLYARKEETMGKEKEGLSTTPADGRTLLSIHR